MLRAGWNLEQRQEIIQTATVGEEGVFTISSTVPDRLIHKETVAGPFISD